MFRCSACPDKSYASQKALNKHDRLVHNIFKLTRHYQCDYSSCAETFPSIRKLLKHRTSHKLKERISQAKLECEICGKFYSSKSCLRKHENDKHKINLQDSQMPTNSYECYQCGSTFSKKVDIISHVATHKTCHRRLQCPVETCKELYVRYKALRNHLTDTHYLHLEEEKYEFKSNIEFQNWKIEKERVLKASYVQNTSKKCLRSGVYKIYYECHRSLSSRFVKNRQRNLKSMGTNKINRACPSTLVVTYHSEENISAVFYPVHVGHSQDLGRLRIDETDRLKIAEKLSQGITVDRVLHDIREDVSNGHIERIHLVKKKDINNIIRDFSIGYSTKRHKNDALSVKSWVNDMTNLEQNPVLYYEEQGEESVVFEQSDHNDVQEDVVSIPSSSSNKDFLNSKLEVTLGLNTKFNVTDADKSTISKYLDKIIDIYNLYGQVNFDVKEAVNVNKKIDPQNRIFSSKTKKKVPDYPHPLPFESKMLKLELSNCNVEVLNIETSFDHDHSYTNI